MINCCVLEGPQNGQKTHGESGDSKWAWDGLQRWRWAYMAFKLPFNTHLEQDPSSESL